MWLVYMWLYAEGCKATIILGYNYLIVYAKPEKEPTPDCNQIKSFMKLMSNGLR
ncbi:MAG: hypothetical protein JSW56_06485 [Deltaproteobacteria bacterium]|nr:MAG: hypothetical protein JSW56_06485 [Deltaproteobacteria bacterium]